MDSLLFLVFNFYLCGQIEKTVMISGTTQWIFWSKTGDHLFSVIAVNNQRWKDSDNSEARNTNQGLMSKLFFKHPSSLKSFISYSHDTFLFLRFGDFYSSSLSPILLSITLSKMTWNHYDQMSPYFACSLILLISCCSWFTLACCEHIFSWVYLFLRAPNLSRVSFLSVESKIRFTNKPPQSSPCFFNSLLKHFC